MARKIYVEGRTSGGMRLAKTTPEAIREAGRLLHAGQAVALPTETVYGLAADATNAEAVARVYAAKGRPAFNPLIVHVLDLAAAERVAALDGTARALAARHWPGPLTLVLPAQEGSPVASLVTAGLPTVAVRVPAHPVMRAVLDAVGRPLAAPSANASGGISPTRAEHVVRSLEGRVALVLDGGPSAVGIESTIVSVVDGVVRLLRVGAVPVDKLGVSTSLDMSGQGGGPVQAPGQLASHYAPGKPLRLDATEARAGEWMIGFGPVAGNATLSAVGDLTEAAARLFDRLHEADASPRATIAVAPVPETGLGVAVNDRLRRAAAPR